MSIAAVIYVVTCCGLTLFVPWLGVLFYYIFSVGQLQSMFPQHFGTESRVSLMITAATLVGLAGATAIRTVNYRALFSPHTIAIILLAIWVNLSASYSGFIVKVDPAKLGTLTPQDILNIFNKIIIFFILATLLIDTRKKLLWLIYSFAGIVVFYSVWANWMYFSGQFWLFGDNGRLGGKPNSVYFDENYLGMLYVFATPVLYYIGISFSKFYLRYGIWSLIPMTWHALFLTGSRGALVSLGVVIIYLFFRSFHRLASIGIVVSLVVAVIFQSGVLLNRVDDTISEANYQEAVAVAGENDTIDPRIISWKVGAEIVKDYPVFGVGVGNFLIAFSEYSNTERHVAHNTFIQFAADCGIVTGLIYLWWYWMRLKNVFRKPAADQTFAAGLHRDYLEDLLNSLYIAMFMIGMFLDLMIYEILYMVFLFSSSKYIIDNVVPEKQLKPKKSIYTSTRPLTR